MPEAHDDVNRTNLAEEVHGTWHTQRLTPRCISPTEYGIRDAINTDKTHALPFPTFNITFFPDFPRPEPNF